MLCLRNETRLRIRLLLSDRFHELSSFAEQSSNFGVHRLCPSRIAAAAKSVSISGRCASPGRASMHPAATAISNPR